LLLACWVIVVAPSAMAQEAAAGSCRNGRSAMLSGLDRSHVRGEFRIFYTLEGRHALADVRDVNRNGIPDKVEDVATQLTVGGRIFSEVMGLIHPLEQPRYARATSIDVFLLNMEKGNGLAYDEVMNYRHANDGSGGRCALRIDLKNSHSNQNVTPIHELFHQYQYGYSMFKARWFLEGTARWAEYALRAGSGPQRPLPTTLPALQEQVFSRTYASSTVWNRLGKILDPVGRLQLPADLARSTYVDGSLVIHDDLLHGAGFIKTLFEMLGQLSHQVAERNAWRYYDWKEEDQRSAVHDVEMFRTVLQSVHRQARKERISTPELERFLALQVDLK